MAIQIPVYVRADTIADALEILNENAAKSKFDVVSTRVYALGFEVTKEHVLHADYGMAIVLDDGTVGHGWYRIVTVIEMHHAS